VFLDAVVVRCVLLPAVLELLGDLTWKLPRWLEERLPHMNIEGGSARATGDSALLDPLEAPELEADKERVSA
jgi:RND superfamily putative drug exporter